MIDTLYKSKFAPYMVKFIQLKIDIGTQRRYYQDNLRYFDEFLCSQHPECDFISKEIIDSWRQSLINNSTHTIYHKFIVLNAFCRYLNNVGVPCYIPRLPKYKQSQFIPYIFTHQQIHQLFEYFDGLRMSRHTGNCHFFSIPVLFRVLYGTGIRIGEAVTLKNKNIDMNERLITLEITKNNQHRVIPINDSLYKVLLDYIEAKRKLTRLRSNGPDDFFFISVLGDDMRPTTIHDYFKKALKTCNIARNPGRVGPRIHDLRHTFAVHSMEQLCKSGYDMYASMPILSIFLGHKDFRDTEAYVRLTKEMFPELIVKHSSLSNQIFE